MKLSLIVPIYRSSKSLPKFFDAIVKQLSNDVEIVCVVDSNLEDVLSTVSEYVKSMKGRVSIVFNSRRVGRTSAINVGTVTAKGEYSIILSTSNIVPPTLVKNILKTIQEKDADIIEFNAVIKEPLKFDGKIRKSFKTKVRIREKPEIIAYTYPFDFNKVFKTRILIEATKHHSKSLDNSRFSIEHVYKALMIAETYATSSKALVQSKSPLSSNFNPLKLIRQWSPLHEYSNIFQENAYEQELLYAEFFHESIVLFALVGVSKNKMLMDKVKKAYSKNLETRFNHFFENNKYAFSDNKEMKLLKDNKSVSKLSKIYKEFN